MPHMLDILCDFAWFLHLINNEQYSSAVQCLEVVTGEQQVAHVCDTKMSRLLPRCTSC